MDKTAQKRSIPNKLRELINEPAARMTGFFRPEHERVMAKIRELDDRIRAELTGKQIGGAMPLTAGAAKELLKSARRNFSRNEFITGISELAAFHEKMREVVNDIKKLEIDVNKIHHKFLFEGMDDEKLKRMRSHMERKAELELALLMTKEAGVMDFFHNLLTPRGRALSAWVKKYPKETKDLRDRGAALVEAGQSLYDNTLGILKRMATARATRRPDAYVDEANKITAEFARFDAGDKGFTSYYHNVVMPFLKTKDAIDEEYRKQNAPPTPQAPPSAPTAPEGTGSTVGPGAAPAVPAQQQAPKQTLIMPTQPMTGNPPGASPPFAPPVPDAADTERHLPVVTDHKKFMESLESMGGEDPRILAGYIAKYAKSIQTQDPEVAIQLFSIVRQLRS